MCVTICTEYHFIQEKYQPSLVVDCSWLAVCALKIESPNTVDPSRCQHLTLTTSNTTDKHNENTQHERLLGIYAIDVPQKGLWIQTIISSPGPNDWRGTDFTSTEIPAKTLRQLGKLLARRTRSRKEKRDRRGEADKLQWKSRAGNPA